MPRYTTTRHYDDVATLDLGGGKFWLCRGAEHQATIRFTFGLYPPVIRRHWPNGAITNVYWRYGVPATCNACNRRQLVFPTYEGKVYDLRCCGY